MTIKTRQFFRQTPASEGPRAAPERRPLQPDSHPRIATVSIPDVRGLNFEAVDQPEKIQRNSNPSPREPQGPGEDRAWQRLRGTKNAIHQDLETIRNAMEQPGSREATGQQASTAASRPFEKKSVQDSPAIVAEQTEAGSTNFRLDDIDGTELQIQPLVQSILEHWPGCGTSTIMLAGTENNPQLEITATKMAVALQAKTGGRVLLVDSDTQTDGLTRQFGCRDFPGLTDWFKGNAGPQQFVRSTSHPKIDFLPTGTQTWCAAEQVNAVLKKTMPQLVDRYDMILIHAGDAHGAAVASWTPFVIGTWLMVSLTGSNQTVARSAVSQLNEWGARLLGCIVSDCTGWNR